MSDSWLNTLPAHEREKIRKRLRSPEEYERLREKVKGPADLERELKRAEQMAELKFSLESDPGVQEKLKKQIERAIKEEGVEKLIESPVSPEATHALERGQFRVTVGEHPQTHEDHLLLTVSGNVQETLPINSSMQEKFSPSRSEKS